MTEYDRSMLLELLFRMLHQYEDQYKESLEFIRRYGREAFASDYAAVAASLSRVEACKEIMNQITLFLDTLPPN